MSGQVTTHHETTSLGSAAVDGLLAGAGAGLLMALALAAAALTGGEGPAVALGRFDPGMSGEPLRGMLAHLAMAGVYGALFGAAYWLGLRRLGRLPLWLLGLVYGMILLILAVGVTLPAAGSPLQEVPVWQMAIAHVVYGAALGLIFERAVRRTG
jgi:hypothetical protein